MRDRWEGSYTYQNIKARPAMYGENYELMEANRLTARTQLLQMIHMHCWHLAEAESAAMWEIYQREGRGVAVRSTWGRLTGSLATDRLVFGGKVRYIDYTKELIPEGNVFDAFMHKRDSYAHEREARLVMLTGQPVGEGNDEADSRRMEPEPSVVPVPVDLSMLVERVYVAPDAPAWIRESVEDLTRTYGFDFEVRQSDLDSDPIA